MITVMVSGKVGDEDGNEHRVVGSFLMQGGWRGVDAPMTFLECVPQRVSEVIISAPSGTFIMLSNSPPLELERLRKALRQLINDCEEAGNLSYAVRTAREALKEDE